MATIVPVDNISHDDVVGVTNGGVTSDVTGDVASGVADVDVKPDASSTQEQTDEMDRYVEGFERIKGELVKASSHVHLMKRAKHDQERVAILTKHVEDLHNVVHLLLAQMVDMNNIFSSH